MLSYPTCYHLRIISGVPDVQYRFSSLLVGLLSFLVWTAIPCSSTLAPPEAGFGDDSTGFARGFMFQGTPRGLVHRGTTRARFSHALLHPPGGGGVADLRSGGGGDTSAVGGGVSMCGNRRGLSGGGVAGRGFRARRSRGDWVAAAAMAASARRRSIGASGSSSIGIRRPRDCNALRRSASLACVTASASSRMCYA